jgi:anti-anti-sigma regulatory factor
VTAPVDEAGRALQSRISLGQAQYLLVGLTGCRPAEAARALVRAAADFGVVPAAIARMLLREVEIPADLDYDTVVARVELAVLAEALLDPEPGRPSPSVSPVRPDRRYPSSLTALPFRIGGLRGITVRGSLDLSTVALLDAVVGETYVPASVPSVLAGVFLLDLAEVTFLDSVGIAALRRAHRVIRDRQEELRVVGPTGSGPRMLLALAASRDWLDPVFGPPVA